MSTMSAPAKYDVKTQLPDYRARRGTFELLEIPRRHFLMIDGAGIRMRPRPMMRRCRRSTPSPTG